MTPSAGAILDRIDDVQFRLVVGLAAALLASVTVIWIATGELLVTLVYALGVSMLLAGGLALQRIQTAPVAEFTDSPDWSVTVAAIDFPGEAIAITDRANRLKCAN